MMITFGNEELLADGREDLPRIINIARPTRELAISTVTAVNQGVHDVGDGAHVHIAMPGNPAQIGLLEPKPATIMKLLATDPESMSIRARPTQRLQLLALNVIVDQVLNRAEMGFESDIATAIADLVDKTSSSSEEKDVEGGGEEAQNPAKRPRLDPESAPRRRLPHSFYEFQRMARYNVFFSPYLKYHLHFRIINCTVTRERITSLNPHFYTTSSAPFEGTVTAIDGVDTNFLAKLTRDVDRDSATVDLIFLGLPSPALVKECVRHVFYRMSSGTSLLGSDHVLRSFHCRFECLPRRHRAMQDIFEFSAAFPRKSAFDMTWEEYADRTVAWCDRLVADTAPLRRASPSNRISIGGMAYSGGSGNNTDGQGSAKNDCIRPQISAFCPKEEPRTSSSGTRTKQTMRDYRQANFVQDPYFTEFDLPV